MCRQVNSFARIMQREIGNFLIHDSPRRKGTYVYSAVSRNWVMVIQSV